jgi:hypothetical protein
LTFDFGRRLRVGLIDSFHCALGIHHFDPGQKTLDLSVFDPSHFNVDFASALENNGVGKDGRRSTQHEQYRQHSDSTPCPHPEKKTAFHHCYRLGSLDPESDGTVPICGSISEYGNAVRNGRSTRIITQL